MFNLLIHTALGLVSFSRCQVPGREVSPMSVDPQRRRKKVDFLWFQKLLKVKKFCTSNYLFLSAAGLLLCKQHFTTLSTCWSGFEEWWQRSGKLLTGSPGVGCCPGGWPGVRDDNSNYRGTGGCSSVPLNGDQNIFVLDLLMKSSWEVSWSSEIVLGWDPDWTNAPGTGSKILWMR